MCDSDRLYGKNVWVMMDISFTSRNMIQAQSDLQISNTFRVRVFSVRKVFSNNTV